MVLSSASVGGLHKASWSGSPGQFFLPDFDAEVRERIQQLERTKDQPARLEALQWLQMHAAAKNATLAIPALERTVRDDPVRKVREKAVLALFHFARKQKLPHPLTLVEAIFDLEHGTL
jgi:hypothetical protein